jgi:MOSC domain-containing protein YiiM
MQMPQFPKLFMASGRTGFYLRVLQEGEVGAGDVIERIEVDPEKMTVQEVFHLAFRDQENLEAIDKALRLRGLSPGWRSMFAERQAAR